MATVKGLTIGIGADAKEFNKELKSMDRNVRNTQREVKTLAKSLDVQWDSKRFAAAQKAAQAAIEQTDVKVKALRDRMKHLDETGTDKQSAHYQKIQNELVNTEAKAVLLKREMEKIKDLKIDQLAEKFQKVGTSIENAGKKLAPMSAAAAGLLAGFAAIGKAAVDFGDDVGTTAQQLNISTDALQKWRYVAEQTDVPIQQFENGLRKIQAGLGSLTAGESTDPIAVALSELGISAEQASKGMGANFEDIIGRLAGMEDATMQAHYANEIFGARMGANLIPMLNDGGEGLAALSAEFENFNYMAADDVAALDAFEDTMQKVKYGFTTMVNQMGVSLLPLMESFAAMLQEKVIPAVQIIADKFSSFSLEQQKIVVGVLAFIAALAPALLIVGKLTGSMGGVIKAVKGVRAALTFLAAHPIVAVIILLIGLMFMLYNQNEQFKASIDGLFASLSNLLMPILGIIGQLFTEIFAALMPLIQVFMNVLAPVLTIVVKLISFLVGILAKVLVPYLKFVGKVWGEVFGFIPKMIQGVVDGVEWMINKIIGGINKLITKVNNVGKYVGITIGLIDEVDFNDDVLNVNGATMETSSEVEGLGVAAESAYSTEDPVFNTDYQATAATNTAPVTNNDYSQKDVEINVTVENYAENVDVDDLVVQINQKLALQM